MTRWVLLVALGLSACASVQIRTDFEGGEAGVVTQLGEDLFECRLRGQSDQDGRNRQVSWYSFRLDHAKGRTVTVRFTDLRGEYNYKRGGIPIDGSAPPVISEDGETWRHLAAMDFDAKTETASITLEPKTDAIWVAHIEPYTWTRLNRFLDGLNSPHLVRESVGQSVEHRDLHLLTITDRSVPDVGKPVVWLMCRQHAWESGTSLVGEGAIQYLLSDAAADLRRSVVFKIYPMVDPDGCYHGGVRFNRHGYDVNRNWDSCDPANAEHRRLMPEIAAIKQHWIDWRGAEGRIDLFMTLHNQERGGWISGSAHDQDVAHRLFDRLKNETSCDLRDTTPRGAGDRPAPGRLGVYQYVDRDLGAPGFLLEQGVARDEKLGHLPTSTDRRRFGAELARVMAQTALDARKNRP